MIAASTNKPTVSPVGLESLQGKRVLLARPTPEQASFLCQCYENDEFMDLYRLSQSRQQTEEQIRERLTKEQKFLPQQLKRIEWVIHYLEGEGENVVKCPIGLTSLAAYQQRHRRAEFSLGIVRSEDRVGGVTLESYLLSLDFAFNVIKLHKVFNYIYEYNANAQKNALEAGFTQDGFLRDHIKTPNGFIGLYMNSLLAEEFHTNKRLSRLSQRMLKRDITVKPASPQMFSPEELVQATKILRQNHPSF